MYPQLQDYLQNYVEKASLQEEKKDSWPFWQEKCPSLVKGWFELAHLSKEDRIDFLANFWLKKMPYVPHIEQEIRTFFKSLEDILIYLVKEEGQPFFEAKCFYLCHCGTLFVGMPPMSDKAYEWVLQQMDILFPEDYLSFFQIHCKLYKKGIGEIFSLEEVKHLQKKLIQEVFDRGDVIHFENRLIDPRLLIPFYINEDKSVFQCFFKGWYPGEKMGNVMWDAKKKILSAPSDENSFPTFLDWFVHFLETK